MRPCTAPIWLRAIAPTSPIFRFRSRSAIRSRSTLCDPFTPRTAFETPLSHDGGPGGGASGGAGGVSGRPGSGSM